MSALALLRRPAIGPLLGAQLFTALGDNALLIVAIALLEQSGAGGWMSPALRICLYLSYVLLAPFAGVLADRVPKGRLIVMVNLAKLGGCLLLAAQVHPLVAFGAIGVVGSVTDRLSTASLPNSCLRWISCRPTPGSRLSQ
jgi:LPLT family lysophospholipid transporter-like MFS transporter